MATAISAAITNTSAQTAKRKTVSMIRLYAFPALTTIRAMAKTGIPPYKLSRDVIEAAINYRGCQLFRLNKRIEDPIVGNAPSHAAPRERSIAVPFGRPHLPANKLCKRQASSCRLRMLSGHLRLPQGPHNDYRCIACVLDYHRCTLGEFGRDRRRFPPRNAATPMRMSSTHHRFDILRRKSRPVASAKRSSDLEIDRGLFSPIALDLVLDGLSLV